MSPFLQLALELAIILFAAKVAGYLSTRLGQPSVLGELLVGILLGPSLIDIPHWFIFKSDTLPELVQDLGEVGVLLLMFLAGLELHFSELTRNTRVSILAGLLGVVFPVGLGWGVGRLFGQTDSAAIILGLAMGATSVSISAQTLMELKVLRSRVGLSLLGAAVFDDILIILLLSAFLAVVQGSDAPLELIWIAARMFLFLAGAVAIGLLLLPRLMRWTDRLPISQGVLALALIVMLLYSVAAEVLGGMAAITGAFLAGLMFARCRERERIESGINALAYGLFVPIFFIGIGLSVDLRQIQSSTIWLLPIVILGSLVTKFIGAGLGGRLGGLTWREAWQLGAGMLSRGEVGLIVAGLGVFYGLMNQDEFSAILGMVIFSTLITPPLLRFLFKEPKRASYSSEALNQPGEGKESA
ncbi:MAG: cation:proton antiporter [Anaerolineales bacterium]|nr:cation:proton antiporter [Anaerolineales bacterium]MCX7608496.1 cation:proton antiporter [Anaerolineales bacterium]MDW8227172.1 cation:proton antiporter [Anaerolineales bacterium]